MGHIFILCTPKTAVSSYFVITLLTEMVSVKSNIMFYFYIPNFILLDAVEDEK